MSETTKAELIARILTLEDQLAGVCAHRDRLRVYERQWKEHQDVIRATTMDDTLHISLRMNVDGRYNTRDCVVSLPELRQNILGPSIIGSKVIAYYHAMVQAIKQANAAESKD